MATVSRADGTTLHYEVVGDGNALVLVHGSWGDSTGWAFVVPGLAESFRVVTYDRCGHGASGGPPADGTVHDDVADLAALIEHLDLGPAHVCGNSYGTNIALRLAIERPELVRRLAGHEPPLLGLLRGRAEHAAAHDEARASLDAVRQHLEAGDNARGAELFVEDVAIGKGMWALLPTEMHDVFTANGPTFLGELRDPDALTIDLDALVAIPMPLLLTDGDASPPMFAPIMACLTASLPGARRHTFAGAGHVPQLTHPDEYVSTITDFLTA
ncbi:alpha/beta fold hydrolase [Desertimonas flava]|uniref:alpha/beta fold hydrolase n=1 Tax=Desertimonas flava TaxID=2064846 RepID=UPI000E34D64D|nr:alpha/beta hydrolase [Desertimonas flava]